jgi:signal transduction histidine kinase/ActR/RegA family two-component response regulator
MTGASIHNRRAFPVASAALLEAILAALEFGVAIVDRQGKILLANSSWRRYTLADHGRPNQAGETAIVLDLDFPQATEKDANRKRVEGLKRVIRGTTDQFTCDLLRPTRTADNWFRLDAHRFDHAPGTAIFIVTDISARKRAEKALRNSQDQLYQSQKMEALGTLVAGMAHEINNPTSLIMFNLPIVRRVWADVLPLLQHAGEASPNRKFGGYTLAFLEDQFLQLVADMEMAASRISKIVKDLRNFSRRSQIHEKGPVDINAAITAAVRLAQTTIRKSGVELRMNLAEDLPRVQGNQTSIEQVTLNVIINAIQAIDHDQGRIDIQSGAVDAEGLVYISVRDNGCGISPEVADKIFDPFVTDKQDQGGTGLGLAVSYNLVKAHDGQITFRQPDDGGTLFTVSIPTEAQSPRPRILVVDDDATVRRMMLQAIRKNGQYLVDEAANGVDGLIKIGSHPPDLLILDLMMPGMNGLEVCQAIHDREPFAAMKVLITTGHPHHPDLQKISALGFTNVHAKPFTIAGFLHAIADIMKSHPGV